MSKFINLSGTQVLAEATNEQGVRIELCTRPAGSTVGIQYVRVFVNGQGVSTEQFSGYRANQAAAAFLELVRHHAARLPEAAQPKAKTSKAPKAPAATEEVVYEAGDVQVIKISGKPMEYRTLRSGQVVDVQHCAPQSWRKTQETVIAAAKAQ